MQIHCPRCMLMPIPIGLAVLVKSTLVKEVTRRGREGNLFDESNKATTAKKHEDGKGDPFQVPDTFRVRGRLRDVPGTCHGGRVRLTEMGDSQSLSGMFRGRTQRNLDPAIAVAGNEESEESGTESESESDTATPNVKPLATKPMEDMNAKKPISETVERRLKKKFENNASKGKKGEDRSFSKAHEHNAFELSKKIWGKEGISGKVKSSAAKSNGKAKANNKAVVALKAEFHSSPDKKVDIGVLMEVDKVPKSSVSNLFDKRFCVSGLEEELLKHSLDMVDSERKATLEARWRKLQIAELELFIERNELYDGHIDTKLIVKSVFD
ncbi:RmlC-like cupins superfamily protein [Hibiscus syriacus]|uniref:RmlC-like cupins superfamily protein n=1 Tax=Hibiscus syriacus TaxID=106335 RepID=A0A6A3AQP4_HIBSY|nr:RmlC-like cupins superfamily protein [Hibiscus syriacus]